MYLIHLVSTLSKVWKHFLSVYTFLSPRDAFAYRWPIPIIPLNEVNIKHVLDQLSKKLNVLYIVKVLHSLPYLEVLCG
jgi:hypothetical protein